MPVIDQRAEIAIQTILLATDFSTISETAAAYAKALAHRFGSMVELTHVIDLSVATHAESALVGLSVDEMRRESGEKLERLLQEFSGTRTRIKELEAFSLPEAILKSAKDSEASLIVMGTASKHGLEKLIVGSTAETVIRKSACPVLTVGPHVAPPQDPLAFRTIVCATDFSGQAAKAAVYALSFAQDSGAHLYLCHVLGVSKPKGPERLVLQASFERSLKKLIPQSAYDWCIPECVIEHGDTADAILGLAERVQADLIVLGSRKSSFWLNYIETGVTPAILAAAKCPVLTVC
jgi:nucleotide-binding universal stress UspA family protein